MFPGVQIIGKIVTGLVILGVLWFIFNDPEALGGAIGGGVRQVFSLIGGVVSGATSETESAGQAASTLAT